MTRIRATGTNRAITLLADRAAGLSTKTHVADDGRGRPLVILLTPGQAGDPPMMLPLLAGLRVGRSLGRPRTRPDRVLADRAYSSRAIRAHLRARGIGSVIPEPEDQKARRKRRGSHGGRPITYDRNAYRGRNVIERAFNGLKHWRGLATRYDKHAAVYRGALVLAAALLWINDLSGVVASVLGVEQALGKLRPALVRRGGELHENGRRSRRRSSRPCWRG